MWQRQHHPAADAMHAAGAAEAKRPNKPRLNTPSAALCAALTAQKVAVQHTPPRQPAEKKQGTRRHPARPPRRLQRRVKQAPHNKKSVEQQPQHDKTCWGPLINHNHTPTVRAVHNRPFLAMVTGPQRHAYFILCISTQPRPSASKFESSLPRKRTGSSTGHQ
jgi:hypothetical protein